MDDLSSHNRERWNELARAGTQFSRPWLDLDPAQARARVDPHGFLGDVTGKEILCLAGAGGQQSVAFALLGARVTVLDLSDEMLARDRQAAAHYGFDIHYQQGDMRDLACFADHSFDIVWHAYSINFVPDVNPVFNEVTRVLKPGGFYQVQFHNPFAFEMDELSWNGQGYSVRRPISKARRPKTSPGTSSPKTAAAARWRARANSATPSAPSSTAWPGAAIPSWASTKTPPPLPTPPPAPGSTSSSSAPPG